MGDLSFERYSKWASIKDPLYATGRPPVTRARERLIVADIARKLELKPEDRLLDIGSGIGTLTIPISFMVSRVTAIDSPACVGRLKKRAPDENIDIIEGNFLSTPVTQSFNKILAYSVLHYLASPDAVMAFINKALKLLERHGRMLLGDIPNSSVKGRFEGTPEGQVYARAWNANQEVIAQSREEYESLEPFDRDMPRDPALVTFDDAGTVTLLGAIRGAGFGAWLLPQPSDLPFGDWREDLLIVRP